MKNPIRKKELAAKPTPKPHRSTFWWHGAKEKYIKDGLGLINEDDPEFDAQKIYQHWLKSFK